MIFPNIKSIRINRLQFIVRKNLLSHMVRRYKCTYCFLRIWVFTKILPYRCGSEIKNKKNTSQSQSPSCHTHTHTFLVWLMPISSNKPAHSTIRYANVSSIDDSVFLLFWLFFFFRVARFKKNATKKKKMKKCMNFFLKIKTDLEMIFFLRFKFYSHVSFSIDENSVYF